MRQTEIPGTEELPLKGYTVVKQELWKQPVYVQARTAQEATEKAIKGDCTIHADQQYDRDFRPDLWEVTEDVGD